MIVSGIEDDEIGEIAFRQHGRDRSRRNVCAGRPVILWTAVSSGKSPSSRAIVPEHARERAPEPRMRMVVVRQAVRADHRQRKAQHAPHVGLVHLEIDRAGRIEPARRLVDVDAPFRGDVVQGRGRSPPDAGATRRS